jgi:hypothetical protein
MKRMAEIRLSAFAEISNLFSNVQLSRSRNTEKLQVHEESHRRHSYSLSDFTRHFARMNERGKGAVQPET